MDGPLHSVYLVGVFIDFSATVVGGNDTTNALLFVIVTDFTKFISDGPNNRKDKFIP